MYINLLLHKLNREQKAIHHCSLVFRQHHNTVFHSANPCFHLLAAGLPLHGYKKNTVWGIELNTRKLHIRPGTQITRLCSHSQTLFALPTNILTRNKKCPVIALGKVNSVNIHSPLFLMPHVEIRSTENKK